jgi:hypothetical protein
MWAELAQEVCDAAIGSESQVHLNDKNSASYHYSLQAPLQCWLKSVQDICTKVEEDKLERLCEVLNAKYSELSVGAQAQLHRLLKNTYRSISLLAAEDCVKLKDAARTASFPTSFQLSEALHQKAFATILAVNLARLHVGPILPAKAYTGSETESKEYRIVDSTLNKKKQSAKGHYLICLMPSLYASSTALSALTSPYCVVYSDATDVAASPETEGAAATK